MRRLAARAPYLKEVQPAMVTQEANRGEARGNARGGLSWLWIVVLLAGLAVAATIAAVNAGVLPALAAKVLLGVTIALFFTVSCLAVKLDGANNREAPPAPPVVADDRERGDYGESASEVEQVYRWRRMRLERLGVHRELRAILAADAAFSIHELERLVAAGCPLGTALRILQPD
jgi:hypothetical protein